MHTPYGCHSKVACFDLRLVGASRLFSAHLRCKKELAGRSRDAFTESTLAHAPGGGSSTKAVTAVLTP